MSVGYTDSLHRSIDRSAICESVASALTEGEGGPGSSEVYLAQILHLPAATHQRLHVCTHLDILPSQPSILKICHGSGSREKRSPGLLALNPAADFC